MKKVNYIKGLMSLAIAGTLVYSCEKDAKDPIDTETQTSIDNSIAEQAFSQVFPVVHEIGVNEEGVNKNGGFGGDSCVNITFLGDTANFPDSGAVTVIVDYGNGCVGKDGRVRKGIIRAVFTDKWVNAGAQVTVTLEGYSVNFVDYQGTMIATNDGNNTYSRTIQDGICKTADWTITYAGTHTVQQTEGYDTKDDNTDDVYKFTGNAQGTNRKGKTFATVISTPLIKRSSCKWIEEGVFEITPQDLATRIVNYGDGTCDSKATVTINGNVYEFDLMQ